MFDAVSLAHWHVENVLAPGALAVDATAGNGHDTLCLAESVGPAGRVWAFDVQADALRTTRDRLERAGVAERVELVAQGHETMAATLPPAARGQIRAVMFNLGYWPGGPDKTRTTQSDTTVQALAAAAAFLAPGGVVTAVCYTRHPGGEEEAQAVRTWAEGLPPETFAAQTCFPLNARGQPPRLVAVRKRAG